MMFRPERYEVRCRQHARRYIRARLARRGVADARGHDRQWLAWAFESCERLAGRARPTFDDAPTGWRRWCKATWRRVFRAEMVAAGATAGAQCAKERSRMEVTT